MRQADRLFKILQMFRRGRPLLGKEIAALEEARRKLNDIAERW